MAALQKKQSINCKVLVLGKSGVGKSYILLQYTAPPQEIVQMPKLTTVGVDYKYGTEKIEDTEVKMSIWDTAGQEKYRPIIQTYFKNSKAAILVFDLTDKQSLQDVRYWLREVKLQCGKDVAKILVGNKCDLPHEQPDQALIQEYCEEFQMEYIESSALQKINIQEIFVKLAKKIYQQHKASIPQNQLKQNSLPANEAQNQNSTSSNKQISLKNSKPKQKKENDGCC
ncbi:small guanosine triphosphatase family Ras family protein (macronuclear) [Tetrahymena thermophila SB210]|uniref:Small guanosine triphosphatase family Ras family protein n=2 Tax=Tetrahymena thermophila TaxID=5911 RepID=I7MCK7_TETTS|nr:small guanosine triphosphatase family Ras family protein [Tetrahymena thermophila SB210]EAR84132.3 small guanosine triphosphatase family Ras family protein [Tetrahymena thermophila SB210]BAJ21309.1 Rab-family small GTPase RabX7 [Tetrahymena thermophila]|eukprot:XP_001031795.3 small guanosine triphosphatase family Ras family protein [Tetrahymena thermophila SB210]